MIVFVIVSVIVSVGVVGIEDCMRRRSRWVPVSRMSCIGIGMGLGMGKGRGRGIISMGRRRDRGRGGVMAVILVVWLRRVVMIQNELVHVEMILRVVMILRVFVFR